MKLGQEWKKVRKWIAGTLLIILLAGMGGFAYAIWQASQTAAVIYHPVDRLPSEPRLVADETANKQSDVLPDAGPGVQTAAAGEELRSKTFLLLGIDRHSADTDGGRADVIMLAVLNPSAKKLTLLSIPRDTYVAIAGKGYQDKINHSYQYGMETVIATVENFTGVLVDHYAAFNFDGFRKAIDAIGGLTLEVDAGAAKELGITSGMHRVDGSQALAFARFRDDAAGDFGRNDRHQEVLTAALEQTRNLRSPAKLQEILDTVGQDVRTDLAFAQIVTLASQADAFRESDVERVRYAAQTARFGPRNLSYVLVQEAERQRVMEELKRAAATAEE